MGYELNHIFNNSKISQDEKIEKLGQIISGIVEIFTNTLGLLDGQIKEIFEKIQSMENNLREDYSEKMVNLEGRVKAAFEAGERDGTLKIGKKSAVKAENKDVAKSSVKIEAKSMPTPKVAPKPLKMSEPVSSRAQLQSELKDLFKKMKRD